MRLLLIKENGEYTSDSNKTDPDMPELIDDIDDEGSEVHGVKQCLITFKLGTYIVDVWCGVIPMHAAHLLLGRPWQYNCDVIHHGKLNQYSFIFHGKKYFFTPFNPKDVHNDQVKMRNFCKEVMGSKTQNSKKATRKKDSSKNSQINDGPMVSVSSCEKKRVVHNFYTSGKDVRRALLTK
ncbi:hypothetical protein J1N35_038309 [Gossypium stocksii]|uniref:Uncharacterized protein n=1 Tax=Gossypium stocksii TaxID=47602 RepID=A0A9D3ZMR9_9ROSI|nr:hypothetical protein J1N35_038309 [Gossypium stocksii]